MTLLADVVRDTKSKSDNINKKRNTPTMHAQERTFVNWCNLFLKRKGFQIKAIEDLQDGVCVLLILQNFSSTDLECDVGSTGDYVGRNWKVILNFLEGENIHVTESPDNVHDVTRRSQILTFVVWRIILRYQICDDIPTATKLDIQAYKRAPKRLLRWIKSMLPDRSIVNFNCDWTNGMALCDLVNAIQPGLIPKDMFTDKNNDEINARLAVTTADDELGIPELISPYDIATGMAEEKCLMTYLSLFRSANRIKKSGKNSTTYIREDDSDVDCVIDPIMLTSKNISSRTSSRSSYQRSKCVAFGAGLRWGQVGKPSEFFIQVNGPEFADLSISIECRPFDHRSTKYKPGLQIKSIDTSCYVVKYTPTRPGEYILNVFCSGEHISGSPFRLDVHETVLSELFQEDKIMISFNPTKVSYTGSHLLESEESISSSDKEKSCEKSYDKSYDSAFGDDDDLSSLADSVSKSPSNRSTSYSSFLDNDSSDEFSKIIDTTEGNHLVDPFKFDSDKIRIYGVGLKRGEVGLVSSFQVYTPNYEKGPLAVSITCPAMSIPVPSVTTTLHATYMKHDVVYLPTEPGVYQIDVTWGERPLPGSPYYLSVGETKNITPEEKENEDDEKEGKEARISYYRPTNKHNLIIYYSATTSDSNQRVNKGFLEKMLREENPLDALICITIDIEMERIGRKKIFDRASTKKLPMVFVNDKFVGSYEDVMILYTKGKLSEFLLKCANDDEDDDSE